jgi:hypothetical protein
LFTGKWQNRIWPHRAGSATFGNTPNTPGYRHTTFSDISMHHKPLQGINSLRPPEIFFPYYSVRKGPKKRV